jgi:acyl-CoA reductase-like NAD-dependent aldehyde dehydrogenase
MLMLVSSYKVILICLVNAAKSLADGAMYNTGQSCCSVERIYVNAKIYDQFVKEFVEEVKTFVPGDPTNEKTYPSIDDLSYHLHIRYIGALTLPTQSDVLDKQVKDAVAKGAKVLIGGSKINKEGNWFQPTVLTNVNHTMGKLQTC